MKNVILSLLALLVAAQAFGQKVVHTERYAQDNQKLLSRADIGHRVVLMGDSITDFWPKRSPESLWSTQTWWTGESVGK